MGEYTTHTYQRSPVSAASPILPKIDPFDALISKSEVGSKLRTDPLMQEQYKELKTEFQAITRIEGELQQVIDNSKKELENNKNKPHALGDFSDIEKAIDSKVPDSLEGWLDFAKNLKKSGIQLGKGLIADLSLKIQEQIGEFKDSVLQGKFDEAFVHLDKIKKNYDLLAPHLQRRMEMSALENKLISDIVKIDGFFKEDNWVKMLLISRVSTMEPKELVALNSLLSSEGFKKLAPEKQLACLKIAESTNLQGIVKLRQLVESETINSSNIVSIIDSLEKLADIPGQVDGTKSIIHPIIMPQVKDLIAGTLTRIINPETIFQSNVGTCAAASIQWQICSKDPALYAQIVLGLAARDKCNEVKQILTPCPDSRGPDLSKREIDLRLVQAAIMDFANGDNQYSNLLDTHDDTGFSGLTPEQSIKVMQQISGVEHQEVGLERIIDRAMFSKITNNHSKQAGYIALGFDVSKESPGYNGHAVAVIKIENDRVFIFDASGFNFLQNGTELSDSGYRVEDGKKGIFSMSLSELEKRSCRFILPSSYLSELKIKPKPEDIAPAAPKL